ncbi:MAG: E2/UBC family protein [Lacipirellulaceae bacterium]
MTKKKTDCGEPKWRVLVDDVGVPVPQRIVSVAVIRAQADVGNEFAIVRDHNSPRDVVLGDEDEIDLGDGNVFYTLRRCDVQPHDHCEEPAKLALFVDDRAEIVTRREQTGKTVLQLFSIPLNVSLLRDFESPNDQPIGIDEDLVYGHGPVFVTRQREDGLKITVNSRVFTEDDGVKPEMTGGEIAALVYPESPKETCVWLTSGEKKLIEFAQSIAIALCVTFDVVRKGVTGGYTQTRVGMEIEKLTEGGARVTAIEQPKAVIYHDLSVKPGMPVATSDVLVLIPNGYPGQLLDGAYLPEDSPLFGRVKGQPQSNLVTAEGRRWKLVSYHPHTNGIGPAWDPTRHGIHTYIGEIMSWLQDTV